MPHTAPSPQRRANESEISAARQIRFAISKVGSNLAGNINPDASFEFTGHTGAKYLIEIREIKPASVVDDTKR